MRRAGPFHSHSHSRTQIRYARAGELRDHVVAVAGGVNRGTNLHNPGSQRAIRSFHQRHFYRRAGGGAATRGFRHLKLDLQRRELAHTKTFVALGDSLAFANVAAHDDARKRSANARLILFQIQTIDFRMATLDQGLIAVQIEFSGFGFKLGSLEIGIAGKSQGAKLLLAAVGRGFGF